jgi:prephenate dehydrogenase
LAVSHALAAFAEQLNKLRDAVLSQNDDDLVRLLTEAKKVRDALGS